MSQSQKIRNRVFKGIARDGKGTMGWCHGFKLHLACNDRGEIIIFVLTGANISDKNPSVFKVLAKRLYGKSSSQTKDISPGNCLTPSLRMAYSW